MSHSSEEQDPHNRGGLYAFVFSMLFVGVFMLYLIAIHPGVDLDEKVIDPNAKAKLTPQEATQSPQEPAGDMWVSTSALVEKGAKLYKTNCALCHGDQGKGDGPGGAALNPKPRNLVEGQWVKGSGSIALYKTLSEGIPPGMPSYKHMKPEERWALVHFIQSITQNKGSDVAEEIAAFAGSAD